MSPEHSPLPWRSNNNDSIYDADGTKIASVWSRNFLTDEVARLIVLQVLPPRAHPEGVALEQDVLIGNAFGIELDQPLLTATPIQPIVGGTLPNFVHRPTS